MEENGYRFGVGVLVLASAAIGVLLIAFFGAAPTLWVSRYRVTVNFPRAPKVRIDTPVRKSGVVIGRVANVELLKGTKGVELTLELERKHELRMGETPRIATDGIIPGDAVIEFIQPTQEILVRRFDGTVGTPPNGHLEPEEVAAAQAFITEGSYLSSDEVLPDPIEALATMNNQFGPVLAAIERTANRIDNVAPRFKTWSAVAPVRSAMFWFRPNRHWTISIRPSSLSTRSVHKSNELTFQTRWSN